MSGYQLVKGAVVEGIKKGWTAFLWMCKIVIPISLAVALLQAIGWLQTFGSFLSPLMKLLNLPGEAAIPIIVGMAVNIYAAVAVVAVLSFTVDQITLIAIFTLTAHSLILEGVVQYRCGMGIFKPTAIRVGAAILIVFVVSRLFGEPTQSASPTFALPASSLSIEVLRGWATATIGLLAKVLAIVMFIMVAESIVKSMGWLDRLLAPLDPVVKAMGLSGNAAFPWLTAVVFGLLYGGAVIVEDARRGLVDRHQKDCLQTSIGINHSMIEDPLLFAALGPSLLWLWIPRLLAAAIVVHLLNAGQFVTERLHRRSSSVRKSPASR